MFRHPSTTWGLPAVLALTVAVLTGCGSPGSSGTAGSTAAQSASRSAGTDLVTCAPEADTRLTVLDDDLHLQTVDNIIPAVNAKAVASDDKILDLLNSVSDALTTPKLIALNKAVDIDRTTSKQAAADFVEKENLTAPSPSSTGTATAGTTVTVGAANFSESATLAEIYAAVLNSAGYKATVQTLDTRETYLPALENGQVTVFPEYVGTLTEFLNKSINGTNAAALASSDLDTTVKNLRDLGGQRGLTFGDPSRAQDQNAFAVTKKFADKYEVSTLSELAQVCGGLILGAGPECVERPFCQPGLEDTYGLDIAKFVALDAGGPLTKSALRQGEISLGLVFSSDGQLG